MQKSTGFIWKVKVYFDYCLVHLIRNELLLCNLMQRKMGKAWQHAAQQPDRTDARSISTFGRTGVTRTLWLRTVHQSWFIVPQVGTLVAGFQPTCGIIDNMGFLAWKKCVWLFWWQRGQSSGQLSTWWDLGGRFPTKFLPLPPACAAHNPGPAIGSASNLRRESRTCNSVSR